MENQKLKKQDEPMGNTNKLIATQKERPSVEVLPYKTKTIPAILAFFYLVKNWTSGTYKETDWY